MLLKWNKRILKANYEHLNAGENRSVQPLTLLTTIWPFWHICVCGAVKLDRNLCSSNMARKNLKIWIYLVKNNLKAKGSGLLAADCKVLPGQEQAVWDTGSSSAVVLAGQTLVCSWTPAAIGAQRVTYVTFGHWKASEQKTKPNNQRDSYRDATWWFQDPADSLTTLAVRSVVLDVVPLPTAGAAADDPRPVDGVQVAELLVAGDVDGAVVDVAQRAQAQRGQGGAPYHHQGVEPEEWTILYANIVWPNATFWLAIWNFRVKEDLVDLTI